MSTPARHDQLLALLARSGEMSVEALARELDVSRETVRRDLTHLGSAGKLRRFHGGARPIAAAPSIMEKEWPFAQRMAQNAAAKRRIATAATRLFRPEDSLFIDTGSTTVAFAEALVALPSLVTITNAPRIAATLASNSSHKVFLVGGAYGPDAGESLGPMALTCGMDFDLQEAEIAKAMIERADRVTVLADSSKFDRRAVFEVAALGRVHTLVTDAAPSDPMARALSAAGTELIIAS